MVRSIKRLRLKKLAEKIGQKARGFLLIEGILQVVILGMLAVGCSALFSSQFSLLGASQTGNQAQEVASVEAEYLKQLDYDEVSKGTGVHEKQDMTKLLGNDRGKQWQSKVTLLPPINVGDSDDDKIQIARVDVFKPGENASRYSTEVPLSSQGNCCTKLENRISAIENLLRPADFVMNNTWSGRINFGSIQYGQGSYCGEFNDTFVTIRAPFDGVMAVNASRHNASGMIFRSLVKDLPVYGGESWPDGYGEGIIRDAAHFAFVGMADTQGDIKSPLMNFSTRIPVKKDELYTIHTQRYIAFFWKDKPEKGKH